MQTLIMLQAGILIKNKEIDNHNQQGKMRNLFTGTSYGLNFHVFERKTKQKILIVGFDRSPLASYRKSLLNPPFLQIISENLH
jgi:hypothetical protein